MRANGSDLQLRRALDRMVRIASSLDAVVIAEGVETSEDAEGIRSAGIGLAQGAWSSSPTLLLVAE